MINLKSKGEFLNSDEGYLLLSIDAFDFIGKFEIKSVGFAKNIEFKDTPSGKHFALIKLKAGEYYWDQFKYYFPNGSMKFNYKKDEYKFKVEPGMINYPGTWYTYLNFASMTQASHSFISVNSLSQELTQLKQKYAYLYSKYPVKYQGEYNDYYPSYLKHLYTKVPSYEFSQNNMSYIPGNEVSNNSKYIYFDAKDGTKEFDQKYPNIKNYITDKSQPFGNFNPNGKYLIFSTLENGITRIEVLDYITMNSFVVFQQLFADTAYINELIWIDNDSIFYQFKNKGANLTGIIHLKFDKDKNVIGVEKIPIYMNGYLVDALSDEENFIYYATSVFISGSKNALYKIDTTSKKTINKTVKKPITNKRYLKNSIYWLTDNSNTIRFVITMDIKKIKKDIVLDYWFLDKNGDWLKIKSYNSSKFEDVEIPLAISKDETFFYVLTNSYTDKKAVHKYSTKDFTQLGIFYQNKSYDIESIKINPITNDVIGVSYIENGYYKYEFFESRDSLKELKAKYPNNHKFYEIYYNSPTQNILVFEINEKSKGIWGIYNTKTNKYEHILDTNPTYTNLEKGDLHFINIKVQDGTPIEGYLVTPKGIHNKKSPLIVIPHGGPIGIRDIVYTNEVQHFFASHGYSSLKVNYRGSGGYGKKFEQLGYQQWGEEIESDINQVVTGILEKYNIDGGKICAMGSSYGGYSSIMLSILFPDRYKCAVSLAGVTDIPLMFTSSDFKDSEIILEKMKNIAGNPEVNMNELIQKSPVYLIDKIKRPILLFHGIHDKRVVLEHSFRLKDVMDIMNLESELVILKNEGHSMNHIESEVIYLGKSLDFFNKQLSD